MKRHQIAFISIALLFTMKSAYAAAHYANVATGGTASSSTVYNDWTPGKAFDGNFGTSWSSGNPPAGSCPQWLQYDLGAGGQQVVVQYKLYNGGSAQGNWRAWNFAGSNDASTWTTLDTQSGQNTANGWYNYDFSNSTAYRYYRINITQTSVSGFGGGDWVERNDMQLLVFIPNIPPTASSFTASGGPYQNIPYPFATSDFGYSDPDGDPLNHIRINQVPGSGTLYVDANNNDAYDSGEALSNNAQVSKANLDAGNLQFYTTGSSSSTFTFNVNDGTDYSTSTYTATLNVKTAPSVSTSAASSIAAFSATLGGNASSDGGAAITERGVVYSSTDATPEIGETGVVDEPNGSGTGVFSESIGSLAAGTMYYFQAYAINLAGTRYGGVLNFTTLSIPPSVTTDAASSITTTGATLGGTVNANNSSTTVTFEYGLTTAYGTTVTADESPVTGTSDMTVSKPVSGLAPNTTYHFRAVGVNTAGTTNGGDMTFTTAAEPPAVTTDAASSITTTEAVLNGTVNANNSNTTVTFEYGLTTGYGTTVTADESPVTGTSNTAVSKSVSGLAPNTTYHYRAAGVNAGGSTNGSDMTFTTLAAPPTVTTDAASSVTTTGAKLNGTVNANNSSTTVTFEYGPDTGYGTTVTAEESPVTGTANTAVSKSITGLAPNTTYHYRAVGANGEGTTNGSDMTFTTAAAPPAVTTDAASSVTLTGAVLNGTVNANNSTTTVIFEYGLTTGYGTSVTAEESPVTGTANTAVSKTISGLTPNTTYHYRAVGVNSGGTANGLDMTFTTPSGPPAVATDAASSVTTTGAVLNGTVNANNSTTTVTFEYGLTTGYGTSVTAEESPVTGTSNTAVSKSVSGLTPNTTYHYRAVGVNGGGTTNGGDMTFTTAAEPPAVTTDAASSVTTTGAVLNGTVNANNSTTTVTFEYGLTTGYGTSVTAEESPVTGTSNTAVSKSVSGLTPNTTYHYRAVGVNAGGTTNGSDMTFTTPAALPSVATDAASSVIATGAVLNGTVNANNSTTTVTFEYGLTTGYGTSVTADESPVTGTSNTAVSKTVTGLTPNTTYHYRAVGVNGAGTTNGSDMTFTTSAAPPAVTTDAASSMTTTGALLNGTVNANNSSTAVTFEYGLTTGYGTTVTADQSPVTGTSNTAVSKSVSGLTPNTTYHYRAVGVNGGGTTHGSDLTFNTSEKLPTVTTQAVTGIMPTTATGNGTVTDLGAPSPTQHGVCWNTGGTPTLSDIHTEEGAASTTDPFTSPMTGLSPHTLYRVRAYAVNNLGTVYGNEVSFTTTNTPPTITYFRDVRLMEDQTSEWIDFNIHDAETDADLLTVRGESSCQTIMLDHHIKFKGTGTDRYVRLRPNVNQSGVVIIKIFVSDGIEETIAQFNVIISAANDTPVVAPPLPDMAIGEMGTGQLDLDHFVTDVDDSLDQLTWTAARLNDPSDNAVINAMLSEPLVVTIDDTSHVATFKASDNSSGHYPIVFTVKDPEGAADSDTLTVTIYPVNDPPVFTEPLPDLSMNQGDTLRIPVIMMFPFVRDPDNPDSTLIWNVLAGRHSTGAANHDSLMLFAPVNWTGLDTLKLVVSDGSLTDTTDVILKVYQPEDRSAPESPRNITAVPDHEFINVAWDSNTESDIRGYIIYRSPDSTYVTEANRIGALEMPTHMFTDLTVFENTTFYYGVSAVDSSGNESVISRFVEAALINQTAVRKNGIIPGVFSLSQNYPNPFNPVTSIEFEIPKRTHVNLTVYDLTGRCVQLLVDEIKEPGTFTVEWHPSQFESGVYFYRIQAGEFTRVKKCIVIK